MRGMDVAVIAGVRRIRDGRRKVNGVSKARRGGREEERERMIHIMTHYLLYGRCCCSMHAITLHPRPLPRLPSSSQPPRASLHQASALHCPPPPSSSYIYP